MSTPTAEEQLIIREALSAGRGGSGTITLLARAHEIAAKHDMSATVLELRRHIYDLLPHPGPPPLNSRTVIYSILLGLISGTATAFIFSKTQLKRRLGIHKE